MSNLNELRDKLVSALRTSMFDWAQELAEFKIDNVLKEHFGETDDPARIEQEVCQKHGVTMKTLWKQDRSQRMTKIRREIAKRMRDELGMSTIEIGKRLKRKHHTVLNLLTPRGEPKASGPGCSRRIEKRA